ncbi:MAG TPA: acyl-CoA dehydrogenase [Rhodocyclaceae bacterium]
MTTYVAPVKDMMFALEHVAGLNEVAALPGCDDLSAELAATVLDEAGRMAAELLAPLNAVGDRQGALHDGVDAVTTSPGFKQAYKQFAESGWIGLTCDPDYGGQGLPSLLGTAVSELWHASNMAFGLCPMLTQGAIEAIQHHASDELKAIYLPKMIDGSWTGTMNLTEPQAGSDLAAVRSKAVPEGDHYLVSGTKIFITWGEHDCAENIVHLVLARLPDAPPGVKGISLFVVPKFLVNADGSLGARNDLKCVSIEHKLGIHGSPTSVMSFGDNGGATGYLVGEANRGLEYMFTMMNAARLAVGLEGVGIAERALQQAVAYAHDRVQGRIAGMDATTRPIAYHPDVRRMLASMKSRTEAMRALAYLAAGAMDKARCHPDTELRALHQARVDLLIPVVKGWCTELSIEVASTGVQVHGGMGYIEETGACQHLRDARITTIYEGTTAIQANDLMMRKIVRDGGAAAGALFGDINADIGVLLRSGNGDLKAIGNAMRQALGVLTAATEWVLANHAEQGVALVGAVAYLRLFGTVAGGWMMARSAAAAVGLAATDAEFARQKIATAHFYCAQELPLARAYGDTLSSGATTLAAAAAALGLN